MGAVWSALLVGGGLAGALFIWLLRGGSPGDGDGQGGGGGPSPGSSGQELVTKPGWCARARPRRALHAATQMPRRRPPGGRALLSTQSWGPRTRLFLLRGSSAWRRWGYADALKNESFDPVGEWGFEKGQETPTNAATFAAKLPSSNLLKDRTKEVSLPQLHGSGLADQEDWEMVSRHSSWGDVGLGGSLEALVLSPNQDTDYGKNVLVEARGQELDKQTKKTRAVFPESHQVSVRFQIHYITSTHEQFIAITGDHECLGRWNTYIPLQRGRDGLWSHSVSLPANIVVQWKFVVVENGGVIRWEECSNRCLETGHEDKVVQEWWGIH
ncbi:starch-binding domain-containing protein 1 [Rhynchocyon petersi]